MVDTELSKKCVITAAISGVIGMKVQNPNLPYTPEEFAKEAKKCYEMGAAIVHIHTRNPRTGLPTPDLEKNKAVVEAIREACPEIIINLSPFLSIRNSNTENLNIIEHLKPEIATLNTESLNFAVGDWKNGKVIGEVVFENSFRKILGFAQTMRNMKTKPELKIFSFNGMSNVLFLLNQENSVFDEPLHFQFVLGVLGAIRFNPMNLAHILLSKPETATWCVSAAGPNLFQAALTSVGWGGHVRVGLEDNIRLVDGSSKGSWEQVKWASKLIEHAGRKVATPEEARRLFNLYKK